MANENRGPQFERQVLKTLRAMGITCYGRHGQIPLQDLYPGSPSGEHLEIDIVCLVGNICILVETTVQQDGNSEKIKRFIRHCNLITDLFPNQRALFTHFDGIPEGELANFRGISEWRYLYIGTGHELLNEGFSPERYPGPGSTRLHIFNEENWEYVKTLQRAINKTAQYEFFASVGIKPEDIGDESLGSNTLVKPCLKLTNKTLFSGKVPAELFVVIFRPAELLRIARVLRYQGQPMATSSGTSVSQGGGYQRILVPQKLNEIRKFVKEDPKVVFPTNLTLVLSKGCRSEHVDGVDKLHIPSEYASIDVIDGQHRLFSYALSDNDDQVSQEANLIATAIKFDTDNAEEINRYAAQTFITINGEQTKVKRDLIYLISYDVLDDRTPESIAAKILKECDSKPNGILAGIFELRAFVKKNKLGQRLIPIVSIVRELARISKQEKLDAIRFALGNPVAADLEESEALIQAGKVLLERYFSRVKREFQDDWGNEDSLLMCAKYVGAFIRLLETFLKEGLTVDLIGEELRKIKQNLLQKYSEGRSSESNLVFDPNAFYFLVKDGEQSIVPLLSKREGSPDKVHKILNEIRTYRPPTVD